MKIKLLIAALAMFLVAGCAPTVPKAQFDYLQAEFNMMKAQTAKKEAETSEARKSLQPKLDALKDGLLHAAMEQGLEAEVKIDDISFVDNYQGALVKVWIRVEGNLAKYYMVYAKFDEEWALLVPLDMTPGE